jgi:putative membrane protein insertion efficiency factor
MKIFAVFLIKIYQFTISPLLGNNCKFTPSCSHYAILAFNKHGFFRGGWKALKRILKCNPWFSASSHEDLP